MDNLEKQEHSFLINNKQVHQDETRLVRLFPQKVCTSSVVYSSHNLDKRSVYAVR